MITNLSVSRTLAQGKLVVSVDGTRPPTDPFKLTAALLALIRSGITDLESGDGGTHAAEGDRAESSATVRGGLDKIEAALRAGYAGIGAIVGDSLLPGGISDASRLATYTTYGWEQAELGRFTDERLLILGELALQGDTTIGTPAYRYAPALVTLIRTQLDLIEDEEPTATGGDRQVSVDERGTVRDLLQTRISRARHHYCAASDELDSTKELAKISFQPRRRATAARPDVETPPVTPAPPTP
jgi:hypothetical protein